MSDLSEDCTCPAAGGAFCTCRLPEGTTETRREEWVVQDQTTDGMWNDAFNDHWGERGVIRDEAEAIRVIGIFWCAGAKRVVHRTTVTTETVITPSPASPAGPGRREEER